MIVQAPGRLKIEHQHYTRIEVSKVENTLAYSYTYNYRKKKVFIGLGVAVGQLVKQMTNDPEVKGSKPAAAVLGRKLRKGKKKFYDIGPWLVLL